MVQVETYDIPPPKVSLIIAFVMIALLRLTNLSYYLSKFLGFETEINNVGGNAFNFANYAGISLLFIILVSKLKSAQLNWHSGRNIYILMLIYLFSLITGPFTNPTWILYQELFLIVALVLHLIIQKYPTSFPEQFSQFLKWFMVIIISFISFCAISIVMNNSIAYYFEEFNEVFVHTLDDFGIVKQYYGYLLGFVVAYAVFILKSPFQKTFILALVLFTGFGIRSFVIGLISAILIYTMKSVKRISVLVIVAFLSWPFLLSKLFQTGLYDTRFYAYANALDIIQKFPFGVGVGGYHVYTEENSRLLYANLFDVNAILDYIPLAPESDVVYLYASIGPLLATAHFGIIALILWKIYLTVNIQNSFEKCILFYFCFMTFYGISEDNMFSINYWVFFGLASGLAYRLHTNFQKL